MNVTLINIGDELLIGQVVNTNAAEMARMLVAQGMAVTRILCIQDTAQAIQTAIQEALHDADAVVCTGGLGPTKDDVTKTALCSLFGGTLHEDAVQLAHIKRIFAERGYPLTDINIQQSWVPDSCTALPNPIGTAPGMWFQVPNEDAKVQVVACLPGVPFEAVRMMQEEVIPRLKQCFLTETFLMKNIIIHGIGESFLSDLIEPWELSLPAHFSLAYLPQAGMVKLRLSARGSDAGQLQVQMQAQLQALYAVAGKYIVGEDGENMAEVVAQEFQKKHLTLSTAESCTGGYVASQLTRLPGCSTYFKGGVVSYSNEAKHTLIGVPDELIAAKGAVSQEVAEAMALGVQKALHSHYAVSLTGVAGPGGGTEVLPVGTVWIGVATPQGVTAHRYCFAACDRQRVIERATNTAFRLLLDAVREG